MSELRFKRELLQPLQTVWSAWTEPDLLTEWLALEARVTPQKNGRYHLEIDYEENHSTKGCKVVRWDPPTDPSSSKASLGFTWKGPADFDVVINFDDQLTTVFLDLTSTPDSNQTVLHLTHEGWRSSEDWQEAREWHAKWWSSILDQLQSFLEHKINTQ